MNLNRIKSDYDGGMSKAEAIKKTEQLSEKLSELQELLFASGKQGLLIVLQGRDTSGKDGSIRHLLTCLNAQTTRVESFKQPTPIELAHDFLWRVHSKTPGRSETVIFNRSHYEDVLVVRVHEIVPKEVWSKRYDRINEFESLLQENGIIVVKFMLHISKDEQEQRLIEREKDPSKAWKVNPRDWKEREFWDNYTEAYEAVLDNCHSDCLPWHVVPADHKWYRNYVITKHLYETLKPFEDDWKKDLDELSGEMKTLMTQFRAENGIAEPK
jgi:PPK2 family polyphosphate:nucleotide phosphotransferase